MLQTLAIRGFRGFQSYRLTNLTRVNLLVGKNNCGKTSVLEAIELLVYGGHPSVFLRANARRRGVGPGDVSADVSHMFFGHKCVPGAGFELSSDDTGRSLSVKILSLEEIGDEADAWFPNGTQRQQPGPGYPDETGMPAFGMRISPETPERNILVPVTEDGSLPNLRIRSRPSGPPVHFLFAGIAESRIDGRSVGRRADQRSRSGSRQRHEAARAGSRIDPFPDERRVGKPHTRRLAPRRAPTADRQLRRRNAQAVGDEAFVHRGGRRLSSD